jgi:acyl-[acyl carrier protein]--UDP-N-acetylglucosamine O-acyltransferase
LAASTTIEEDVVIGDNRHIGSGVHLYKRGCRIGDERQYLLRQSISATPQTKVMLDESATLEIGGGSIVTRILHPEQG